MKQNLSIRKAQDDVAAYLTAKGPAWSGLGKHYYLVTHLVEEIGELARAVINLEDKVIEPLEEAFESSFGAIKNKYPVDHSFRDGRR